MGWGRANAKRGEGKGKRGHQIVDKQCNKQCTSCNIVDGYSRV